VGDFVRFVAGTMSLMILARCVISWMSISRQHPLCQLIERMTEPILVPIRKLMPPIRSGYGQLDLSPMIALIALWLIRGILTGVFAH